MKAILLHHAGGDKYAYRNMQQLLLPEIESIAFELPGRSDRFSEKFVQNLEAAVDDIYRQLIQQLPEEYCIIGNSMGSIMGFLLTHKLKEENKPLPKYLFLASRLSPDAYKDEPNIIGVSSEEFWKVVQQYNGVPEQLLQHKELKEFYEPILRADFEVLEKYNAIQHEHQKLDIKTHVIFGNEDANNITLEIAKDWSSYFTKDIVYKEFNGGHFFAYENEDVVAYIKSVYFRDQHFRT